MIIKVSYRNFILNQTLTFWNSAWENSIVQNNVEKLVKAGIHFIGPCEGKLADGRVGVGRMAEIEDILKSASDLIKR